MLGHLVDYLPGCFCLGLGRLVTHVCGHMRTLQGCKAPSRKRCLVSDIWMPPRGALGSVLAGTRARQYTPTWWMLSMAWKQTDATCENRSALECRGDHIIGIVSPPTDHHQPVHLPHDKHKAVLVGNTKHTTLDGMTCPTSCTVRTESFSSVSTRITLWLSPPMDSTAFPGGATPISGGLQDSCRRVQWDLKHGEDITLGRLLLMRRNSGSSPADGDSHGF
ncbi:hypothetical protein EYF80_035799 [Liparis tanakae]|uniref:Uncharacterized protein n=1 Tax=Liparis tanakae TaxID=230148 RepID=A0A4Z2GL50_9TELE|nr:hypothetical protein EYF80_035799 [Liparis tanakae]